MCVWPSSGATLLMGALQAGPAQGKGVRVSAELLLLGRGRSVL